MIAPFLDADLEWDFRLPRVASINTSGHKYGLVYPGVGWVLWRDAAALPDELVFNVNYLGGNMPTFALNFSRPGAEVVAQYYTFLRLGFEGFRPVQQACQDVATHLAAQIAAIGPFELMSDGTELPVFAFTHRPGRGPATPSSTCPSACGSAAGWCRPTPSRRTAGPRRAADRGPQRVQPRSGRPAAERPAQQVQALPSSVCKPVPLLPAGQRSGFAH